MSDAAKRTMRAVWVIIAVLFLIRLVNYLDRQTLSVLKTTLKTALSFDDSDYSNLLLAFMLPYIIMYLASGWIIERMGTRGAMTMFVTTWSFAGILSGLAQSFGQLAAARALLGAAEPAAFPLSQRVVLNYVPVRNRAFALSVLSPSGSVGAMIAAPVVAFLTIAISWRAAFIIPGVLGLILAALWWRLDRLPPREEALRADNREMLPTRLLLKNRDFWGIVAGRLISDPVWFFFLFWIPGYLQERVGLSLEQLGLVGGIPYLFAIIACPLVGRLVDARIATGREPARVQFTVYAISAAFMPLAALITLAPNATAAIAIISLVTVICQLWFGGTGVLIAARVPFRLNATAAGFIGAVGASAGLLLNLFAGWIIEEFGYSVAFTTLGFLHPLAAIVLWAVIIRRRSDPVNQGVA